MKSQIFKNLLFLRSFIYIFQQEQYSVKQFLVLIIRNPFPWDVEKVHKLDWTFKAKLLFILTLILFCVQNVILAILGVPFWAYFISFLFFFSFSWIYLIISFYLSLPREWFNRWFLKELTRKEILKRRKNGMKVIGITGSYGKTSTKFFLSKILERKYKTYPTPKSHNTLFGIAQAKFSFSFVSSVLEHLERDIEVFIVEMGAYCIGEISELVYAYPPDISILTGITTMHYEKFGSLENTIKAKREIIDGLADGSTCFINTNNPHTLAVYREEKETDRLKVVGYGFNEISEVSGKVENMDRDGTDFSVTCDDKTYKFHTKLIGTGNVENILGAIAVAFELGVDEESIAESVAELTPIESRMEILDPGTGILTINNGFSSNPESFKQSIKTLSYFTNYFKILVTPGIYELGEITYKVHETLGAEITKDIDLVVLLGRTEDTQQILGLKSGLKSIDYPSDKIVFINDITKCYEIVAQRNLMPAVVLLENDLPDIYNI
ncbi:UDP-N-acetylmuramoyl-tripeptide--D-alanyl-D-alanine ligase [Candidatus Dojkabacteria bacterium]|nr:UDP-N-acetylmuramoyl-tripeptide--D-alanyl-D-alanine ligase [Candidatus Dojkabacteria bacterium]